MPKTVQPPLGASTLHLRPGTGATVLECLCAQFKAISREIWLDRFARGRVLGEAHEPLRPDDPYRPDRVVHYFREILDEPEIRATEAILHVDEHLVVVDKPHFLPVTPAGRFVEQTLLRRLMRGLDNPDLAPIHRIDRATAGLVLFSANPATRGHYQALFRERRISKRYLAVAPRLESPPAVRYSRLVRGVPFFRMQEVEGDANTETAIERVFVSGHRAGYALRPLTGHKHQLRVHMAALGAAILGDTLYPELSTTSETPDDDGLPLQLLAESLSFVDPIDGSARRFHSGMKLRHWPEDSA